MTLALRGWRPLLLVAAALCGCGGPSQLVSEKAYAPPGAALERLAVVPFYAHRTYEGSKRLGGVPAEEATEIVTRLVAEALTSQGIEVIPIAEVIGATRDVPRLTTAVDARVFAEIAARELGATGVLLGEVLRFRNALGAAPAARRPASVAYQLTLVEAPDGFKLWSARFDETQPVPEPGHAPGGTLPPAHWLSAAEVAERGAATVARALAGHR